MKKNKSILIAGVLILLLIGVVGYVAIFGKRPEEMKQGQQSATELAARETASELADLISDLGQDSGTGAEGATLITLADGRSVVSGPGASVSGDVVSITAPGTYRVSGTLSDGQITVDCKGNVTLILDEVDIACEEDAAILIADSEHTQIYLAAGSENRITSGLSMNTESVETASETEDDSATGAAIYSKDDLSIAGDGKLTVYGNINNAIATTDHLTVLSGELELIAANNGLKGKDSVTIVDGTILIKSGKDGIKANNDTDEECGTVVILGGQITIESEDDGIQAATDLTVEGGEITIRAGSVQSYTGMNDAEMPQMGHKPDGEMPQMSDGGIPQMPDGEMPQMGQMPDGEMPQMGQMPGRGFGGGFSGGFSGGFGDGFDVTTGKAKGMTCGGTCTIAGGSVTVTQSYEGIEGYEILVTGGELQITASDDGLNAAGDSPAGTTAGKSGMPLLKISGGKVYVNANGDGLDSNGDLVIEGGEVIVDGPADSANGALDSGTENGGSLLSNGGTVLAIGAAGMAETFEENSSQCSMSVTLQSGAQAGTLIEITDQNGNLLCSHTSAKAFGSIVFSSPALAIGETYIVAVGGETQEITLDSISTGSRGGAFGGGMNGGFGRQGMTGGAAGPGMNGEAAGPGMNGEVAGPEMNGGSGFGMKGHRMN